ncbi:MULTISPECIES: hypothetical protein [unclassified Caballeronia]|uniref:hypothetical protein n=1 Tax=unclassified Caballeronia TaxID=2646786 RepID=UPI00025BC308|nr:MULTISPECIES: hypothetical protein [unclassified Caballeronia]EKS70217.1 hypothetical protein BURK_019125 [Burkholderia sp. SJ98]MCE4546521.1 hypothetical protein [Caballeronia sp. PC1]MCE4573006.1 hypothetical protein [Caballeronia sp. CLC5]
MTLQEVYRRKMGAASEATEAVGAAESLKHQFALSAIANFAHADATVVAHCLALICDCEIDSLRAALTDQPILSCWRNRKPWRLGLEIWEQETTSHKEGIAVISPSSVDNIKMLKEQCVIVVGATIREWLLAEPAATEDERSLRKHDANQMRLAADSLAHSIALLRSIH